MCTLLEKIGDAHGNACIRQTLCSDCSVRKCSYFVANTSAQLLLQLVYMYGRHSSHDIVGAGTTAVVLVCDTLVLNLGVSY